MAIKKRLKSVFLVILGILLLFLVFSQTTLGRQIEFPSAILKAFQNLFSGNNQAKTSGIIKNYGPDEYWVYVQPKDDITTPEMIFGRNQKGDIVDIIPLSRGNGAYGFSKEFLIVRVKGLDKELISKLMERYTENEEQIAERKYRLDLDDFKSQNGVSVDFGTTIFTINASDIKPLEKTKGEIASYQKRAKFYAKSQWLRKLAKSIVPPVFAATTNTRYVDPDAAAGGDGTTNGLSGATAAYQSLNIWEAARDDVGDLVTNDTIEEAVVDSNGGNHTADNTTISISGWTTSATQYISIHTPTNNRHAGVWDDTKYRQIITSGWTTNFTIGEDFTRIDGFQSSRSGAGSGYAIFYGAGLSYSAQPLISNTIARATGSAVGSAIGFRTYSNAAPFYCNNCLAYDGLYGFSGNWGNFYCRNCTAVGNTTGFYDGGSDQGIFCDNCLASDNTTDFSVAAGTDHWFNNSASKDATADDFGGAGNRASQTFSFVDATNKNFLLASNDAGAIDFGADLSATSTYPFSNDISGETRSGSWDIGADEYVAPATPAASTPPAIIKPGVIFKRGVILKK